jgi:DnaA family protein
LLVELFNCQVQEHELDLSPEVLKFLIPRLPRNPALITDLVDSMDRESLRDQRKITIPWVNQRLMPHP